MWEHPSYLKIALVLYNKQKNNNNNSECIKINKYENTNMITNNDHKVSLTDQELPSNKS